MSKFTPGPERQICPKCGLPAICLICDEQISAEQIKHGNTHICNDYMCEHAWGHNEVGAPWGWDECAAAKDKLNPGYITGLTGLVHTDRKLIIRRITDFLHRFATVEQITQIARILGVKED